MNRLIKFIENLNTEEYKALRKQQLNTVKINDRVHLDLITDSPGYIFLRDFLIEEIMLHSSFSGPRKMIIFNNRSIKECLIESSINSILINPPLLVYKDIGFSITIEDFFGAATPNIKLKISGHYKDE